jgi:hypothetical protein
MFQWRLSSYSNPLLFFRLSTSLFLFENLSIILPMSTFSKTIVIITVRMTDNIIMASRLNKGDNTLSVQVPKKAPTMVIETLPKKKAVKNLTGLYFIRPRGITKGSSGIGEAAAIYRRGKAQRLIFKALASMALLRFSQICLPMKKVTM